MKDFKSRCIELRKLGFSLNQIVLKTKRAKTSVYHHVRHIALSAERKKEILEAGAKRITEYNHSRRGKSDLGRSPIPFDNWTPDFVNLVGHLIFDGEIKHMGCVYTNRSQALHDQVISSMKKVYKYPPKRHESLPGVFKTQYFNVELSSYLKNKADELYE